MKIWRPGSINDVFAIARNGMGGMRLAAGATALQLEWSKGLPKPEALIDLSQLGELRGIERQDNHFRLGTLSTLNRILADDGIKTALPMLAAALKTVAAPSVRNLATLGGNVAGRTGCLLPALLALDAEIELYRQTGQMRMMLADWLATPSSQTEVIAALLIPAMSADCRWTFRKTGLRMAFSPSVINVGGLLEFDGRQIVSARLAVGGGIVRPARLVEAEALLRGREIDRIDRNNLHQCLIATIHADDDDVRTGAYRKRVAANALLHGLFSVAASGGKDRSLNEDIGSTASSDIPLSHRAMPERWHIRPDVEAKVEASLPYLTDVRAPDMLVGRILRANIPHARILSIDTSAAEALPGVEAVVTYRDIKGENAFGIVIQDQPALCFDKVRHAGDPVAAVAAVDAATAERALALIKVDYAPLPVMNGPEQALADEAVPVHASGNLQCVLHFSRGDVDAAFARAAYVVEDSYVTPRQMHGFMETEGGYARMEDDGVLLVAAGGQHGSRDRMQLARILGLPEEKIRVITSPTGGAFGGKDELTVQPVLALLALKSGLPVRLHLSRAESVLAGQKRNPMAIRMKTACDADGRLLAQEVDVLADAGAYASLGPGVLETALEHAAGPYVVDHVKTRGRLAYTNNGVCGAFRGFGANQMTYAIECQMDRLAALSGLDPIEIRARNMRVAGTPGYLGQEVAKSERLTEMLDAARSSPLWSAPQGLSEDGEWLIGTGMAMNYQGNGLGSLVPDPAGGRLALTADGLIEGAFGLDEMGQGLLTLIQATVSDRLGCARTDVRAVVGDTGLVPESGSTTASRGTSVVWATAKAAGPEFVGKMLAAAGACLGRDPALLVLAPGGFAERGSNSGELLLTYRALAETLAPADLPSVTIAFEFPKNDHSAGNARFLFAFGAALARVAVSRITGAVKVLELHQHSAAGPVMDVAAYLGQLEGGAVQGLGFTFTEDMPMRDGRYLAGNFDGYMMPTIVDAPERLSVFALESLDDDDPHGPRGSGELGIGAVTPAIANAVAAAIGNWPAVTPFYPETILDALA